MLVGPTMNPSAESTAWLAVKSFFLGRTPPIHSKFSWVDVKDAARAHLLAVKVPEAAGHRFLLNGWTVWIPDMIDMINKEFSPQGYTIRNRAPPYALLWAASFFSRNVRYLLNIYGNDYTVSTEKAEKILGMKFTPVDKVMLE